MAKAVLICQKNSCPFSDRTLSLENAVKIGRTQATPGDGMFDCKVLSRNHALLCYEAGKFYLQDTKSSNGTFVNNQRVSKGSEESPPFEVCSGDILQFGVDVKSNGCIIAKLKLYLPSENPSFKWTLLENGRVKCDACGKDFSEFKNARQHFQTIHIKNTFQCKKCDKEFSALRYMKDHMRNMHGISAKQIPSTTKTKSSITKTKSSTSFTKLTKKAVKKEASEKVIKEKKESIED